jgi:hypothetical protein
MPVVVVDTNALRNSPGLSSKSWQSLVQNARAWGVKVVVPSVVVMETINLLQREMATAISAAERMSKDLRRFGLPSLKDDAILQLQLRSASFEDDFRSTLKEANIDIVDVPSKIRHEDVALRAIRKRAPYSAGKDKDCYRDTLIWLTLIEIADANPWEDVWLVSANTNDFGVVGKGQDGFFPAVFRDDLLAELEEEGLAERVKYATKLESLEAHLAAERTPLIPKELHARLNLIDDEQVNHALRAQLRGLGVAPDSIPYLWDFDKALIVDVQGREVPSVLRWELRDTADRADGSWTAIFGVIVPLWLGGVTMDVRTPTNLDNAQWTYFLARARVEGVIRADGAEWVEVGVTGVREEVSDSRRPWGSWVASLLRQYELDLADHLERYVRIMRKSF